MKRLRQCFGAYEKNGFTALHSKKYTKKTRTLPMWADIYPG
jgi:hypothetical protein